MKTYGVGVIGCGSVWDKAHRHVFGQAALPGLFPGRMDAHQAFAGESAVHFPAGATRERLVATLELIRTGGIRVAPLVTHPLAGADFAESCRLLGSKDTECLGIALAWNKD